MVRRILAPVVVGAVLAAIVGVTAAPASALSGGLCQLDGVASFSPGLSNNAQTFSYSFHGTFSGCQSDQQNAPTDGTVSAGEVVTNPANGQQYQEPVPTGYGSCADGTTGGTAIITWADGTQSVATYYTSSAGAAVNLQGSVIPSVTLQAVNAGQPDWTIATTRYASAQAQGALVFGADATQCNTTTGVTSATINGVVGVGTVTDPPPSSPYTVAVSATPSSLPTDGASSSTVIATVTGFGGQPVPNDGVTFRLDGTPAAACGSLLNPATGKVQAGGYTTSPSGQVTVTYRSSKGSPGTCRVAAFEATTAQTSSAAIGQFQYSVGLSANPSSLPADGTSATPVAVTISNPNTGAPIAADAVTLTLTGAACGALSPPGPYITNSSGQVLVSYRAASVPGSCTIGASEGATRNLGSTTVSQFQYAVGLTANPASLPANGTSTSVVTVTVTNPNTGAAVAADGVTLTLTGAACGTVTPAAPYTTNASGQVLVTYKASTVVGSCTISASEAKTRAGTSTTITQT